MKFDKIAEMDWWMKVYATAISGTFADSAEELADKAVTDLRDRIPTEAPKNSGILWPTRVIP